MDTEYNISEIQLKLEEEFFYNFTSVHTRNAYRRDISHYLYATHYYLNKNYSAYTDIMREDVVWFRNFLVIIGPHNSTIAAPKTIARKLAALSSYFSFLIEKGLMKDNPADYVKRPRRDVRTPTHALTREQVVELLTAIDKRTLSGSMHYALLMTFFTTGLRKSEITMLKVKDMKEINDYTILEYSGKGGKLGQKLLHADAKDAILHYHEMMLAHKREHDNEAWLFQPTHNSFDPTNLNKPLNPKTVNEIISKYGKVIGLNFTISPHSARATFISELLSVGVDIYKVAQEVNHSSVNTTQEYDKRLRKLSDSPVKKINYQKAS